VVSKYYGNDQKKNNWKQGIFLLGAHYENRKEGREKRIVSRQ